MQLAESSDPANKHHATFHYQSNTVSQSQILSMSGLGSASNV